MMFSFTNNEEPISFDYGSPYRNLIAAVIESAVRDLLGCLKTSENPLNASDAMYWLFESRSDYPMTFYWCCAHLELDVQYVRTIILNLIQYHYERSNVDNPALAQKLYELREACERCSIRPLPGCEEAAREARESAIVKLRKNRRKLKRDRKFCL